MKAGNAVIEIVRGSVINQRVDAIVNAANTGMRGGGGVDGAIHRAAGKGLMAELVQTAPHGSKTGIPVVTRAHNLPHKYIIHVAGPRWSGGNRGEADLLAACYRNSLAAASELKIESIAFCSISTGVYGYPIEEAAPLALQTSWKYLQAAPETTLTRVVFALFGEHEHEVFTEAFESLGNLEA